MVLCGGARVTFVANEVLHCLASERAISNEVSHLSKPLLCAWITHKSDPGHWCHGSARQCNL